MMFRPSRAVLNVLRPFKGSTNITGLAVHPNPLPALLSAYSSTQNILTSIPKESVYRQATEAILKHRTSVVERAEGDVAQVEKELDMGQIEEVLTVAQDELVLAGKMLEWKSWEELQLKPPPRQWDPIGSDM